MHIFDDHYYFYLVVKHGGFSAASEATQITKSKLSRRILELEERFNIKLIQRTTRHFQVTPLGQQFYEECQKVVNQIECSENVLLQQKSEPQGLVRISCPNVMLQFQIRPILNAFLQQYPKVQLELELTSRRVDVLHDNIDIAIRTSFNPNVDSSLIVRDVVKTTHCLVASQSLLQGHTIQHYQELAQYPALALGLMKNQYTWHLQHLTTGETVNFHFDPRLKCNDLAGVYYAVKDGLGIADLPVLSVQEDLKNGDLIQVLPDWQSNIGTVQLVYASRKGQRLVIEKLIESLIQGLRNMVGREAGYIS